MILEGELQFYQLQKRRDGRDSNPCHYISRLIVEQNFPNFRFCFSWTLALKKNKQEMLTFFAVHFQYASVDSYGTRSFPTNGQNYIRKAIKRNSSYQARMTYNDLRRFI